MGCHQKPERTIYIKGKPLPVCARCTGILVGFLFSFIGIWFINCKNRYLAIMLLPMIIDGSVQRFSNYESTNTRRIITGFLFGGSITLLILRSYIFAIRLGYTIGLALI